MSHIDQVEHLPQVYTSLLLTIYNKTNLACDQVNIILTLLLCSVLGSIFRRIVDPTIRRVYGLVFGLSFMYCLYGWTDFLLILGFAFALYPLIHYVRNQWVVFCFALGFLVSCMTYQFIYHYLSWRMDLTTSVMGMVMRAHMLVWDIIDGDDLLKGGKNLGEHPSERKYRTQSACTKKIGFFEYLCYMFFFVHAICGSSITIVEYLDICDGTSYTKTGWRDTKRNPEPSWWTVIWGFLQILIAGISTEVGKMIFPWNYIFSDAFSSKPAWQRILLLPMSQWPLAFKYVFAWKALDLAAITSGCAFSKVEYDEKTGQVKRMEWERARNIVWLTHCFAQSTKEMVQSWNMTANKWLTRYLFQRLNPPKALTKILGGKTATNMLIVRMLGALWHGVYPGIYVFYFFTFVITIMVDTWQSFLPTYYDFEHKGVRAWFWRIFWTWFCFFPIYTVIIFFMHWDLPRLIPVVNSVYWWYVPVLPLMIVIGKIGQKTFGIKEPKDAVAKTSSTPVVGKKSSSESNNAQDDALLTKKKE